MHGKIIKSHIPCPCGQSADAYTEYSDHGYCYGSCGGRYFKTKEEDWMTNEFSYQYLPWRGITKETMEYYGVLTKVNAEGLPISIGIPWPNGRTQVRELSEKRFLTLGEASSPDKSIFGMDKFPGGGRAITIHEGALDALSAFQMMGSKYPFVAVTSATSAKKECSLAYDYINSFERIYLALDADTPGREASKAIAELFDFNKVYVVELEPDLKDANAYLQAGKTKDFVNSWYGAKRFMPEGILSSFSEFDRIIDEDVKKEAIPYPWGRLQEMTYGIRTGEVVLVKAMEGIGKTEIFRALEYHVLKTTDANIGIIHLEENKSRSIKGLAGYELQTPCHLPDTQVSNDEIKNAFHKVVKRDDRLHVYSHFGSDDPDTIISTIRFMVAACGCKYVFLDHITMVVTGLQGEDERKALDYISTRLKTLTQELDFSLFMISHVNDEGQTRGSRNISKVADLIISLYRDHLSTDPVVRNTTLLTVEKNRFASKTGQSSRLLFDFSTFMVTEEISPLDVGNV